MTTRRKRQQWWKLCLCWPWHGGGIYGRCEGCTRLGACLSGRFRRPSLQAEEVAWYGRAPSFNGNVFRRAAQKSGRYYVSAISYGRQFTDFNVMWMRSSRGLICGALPSFVFPPLQIGEWIKAYQNVGPREFASELKTVDNRGDRILLSGMRAGEMSNMRVGPEL